MSSSSSSVVAKNVVSPAPTKRNTTAPVVHPLPLLPFYTSLVCSKLSVSKKDIINALNGKTKTRDGVFTCSKKTLTDSLIPIIEIQDCFFKYLQKIDKESAAGESSTAFSLKESLAIELPFELSQEGKMKICFHKTSLTHLNKQVLATKMVNIYKILNFQPSDNESLKMTQAKLQISRNHALCLLSNNIKDYSQWYPGVENEVADSLSRDFHLSNDKLTQLHFSSASSQTPATFNTSPLPQEMSSFLLSMLQMLPEAMQQSERHKISSLCLGNTRTSSSTPLNLTHTCSSNNFPRANKPSSYQHLQKKSAMAPSAKILIENWSVKHSRLPWTTYLRPSETMINQTLGRTEMKLQTGFYNNISRAIKMRIQEKTAKSDPSQRY